MSAQYKFYLRICDRAANKILAQLYMGDANIFNKDLENDPKMINSIINLRLPECLARSGIHYFIPLRVPSVEVMENYTAVIYHHDDNAYKKLCAETIINFKSAWLEELLTAHGLDTYAADLVSLMSGLTVRDK